MVEPKPLSDEQIQIFQDWIDGKLRHYPLGYDADKDARIIIGGFLATIALYKEALDSAMRQVSSLNEGNIADRKKLQEYKDDLASFKEMMFDLDKTNKENYKRIEELEANLATLAGMRQNDFATRLKMAERVRRFASKALQGKNPSREILHGSRERIESLKSQLADQVATIERLRGALEPFALPYDIIENECYGIFLGGLIKRNFIDARQALDGKKGD